MMTSALWRVELEESGSTEAQRPNWSPNKTTKIRSIVPGPEVPRRVLEGAQQEYLEASQATPREFIVGTLLDDRLRLRVPIRVEMEQEGAFYVAKCNEFSEFGYGKHPMSAVDDLRVTLAELYWTLRDEESNLARHVSQTWARLRGAVEERDH